MQSFPFVTTQVRNKLRREHGGVSVPHFRARRNGVRSHPDYAAPQPDGSVALIAKSGS